MDELRVSEIAKQMPSMTDAEYAALRESIAAYGLFEPIWLYRGEILDGRHRYRACVETDTPIRTREYDGDMPVTFAAQLNVRRRHLSLTQRAILGVALEPKFRAEAKEAQRHGGKVLSPDKTFAVGSTNERLAAVVDVSPITMQRAMDVYRYAPDLWRAVLDPKQKITITGAWRAMKGVQPDGRGDGKMALEVIEHWDVPAPVGGGLRDWQRAFHEQKQRARELSERERALRRQVEGIDAVVARRARDLAAADFQQIVKSERMRAATALAYAEKRVGWPEALRLTGMSATNFNIFLTDMRNFLAIHDEGGVDESLRSDTPSG